MKRIYPVIAIAILMLAIAVPLHAQNGGVDGCTDSPENPTAILFLIGGIGAGLVQLRNRMKP